MTQIRLPISSYQHRSTPASTARLMNAFAESLPPDAKTPVILQRTPGIAAWSTVGNGPIYGMHAALGFLFVVSGSSLYKVDSNKVATLLGAVGAASNIDMDSNTTSVVVVNEPAAYYYDGTTFGQITDVDFPGAGDVEFLDNYLLFREPNSGRFFGSDLGSATSFDALNFATAEGGADDLVGMKVDHRQALLFGEQSVEIWENTGATGFPFERSVNGFVELGCLNGRTVAKQDNSVYWVASDYTVRRLEGVTPQRISTHGIEQWLDGITISTLNAFTYTRDGHLFYVLTCSEGTWVYDATTKEWHERGTYGANYWQWGAHASTFGLELVGNSTSNVIGALDTSTYTDVSATQRMEWTYQPVYAEQRRAFHKRLEIVLEAGVGLTTGQGSDPEIMLDMSDDGGSTWIALPTKKIGAIGRRAQRVVWYGLGSAEQRVYRPSVSDPVRIAVTDTLLDVDGGRL